MIYAGIDIGRRNVHIILIKAGNIIAKGEAPAGIQKAKTAEEVYDRVLKDTRLERKDVGNIISTGSSGKIAGFAHGFIPQIASAARGVIKLIPSARTVINVGAEETSIIKINSEGRVFDFTGNDKCAAGTGTFIESMSRALEVPIVELAELSMQADKAININISAQCAVFGESEVVSLIHKKVPKSSIARAVHNSIASRIGSLAKVLGLEKDIVLIGGVANNAGLVDSLSSYIKMDVLVPQDPEYVVAYGAALAAEASILNEELKLEVLEKENISNGISQLEG